MKPVLRVTPRGKRVAEYTWRLSLPLLSLVPTLLALLARWPVQSTAEVVLTIACAGLLAFHLANIRTRIRLDHWKDAELAEHLRVELVLGSIFPAVVLIAILALPPTPTLLIAVGVAFVVAHSFYEQTQKEIFLLIEGKPHLQHGTEAFEKVRLWRAAKLEKTVGDAAKEQHVTGPLSLITVWVRPPWFRLLSRTRTVILYVMLVSTSVALGAGIHGEVKPVPDPRPKSTKTGEAGEGQEPVEGEGEQGGTLQLAPPREDETGACTLLPGDGAPEWAEADLNSLYLGNPRLDATPPPGFDEGGCTTGAIVPAAGEGEFVYAVGKNPEREVRSVAVVSRRFAPAIFLAPAAQRVLHRIRDGQMPIGGYPTIDVAGGDMAVILTPKGSAVLTRPSKHPPGLPEVATPYTELPPTVASAFVAAMTERGAWLWPAPPERRNGTEVFRLEARASEGLPDLEVILDRSSGVATRDRYRYDPPESQLSLPELRHHASSAWWIRQEAR